MLVHPPTTREKLAAEFLGTFVLVFGGCGSAVLAANFMSGDTLVGIGFAGVALAFGLTVVVMAYAVGHVSGGHFNPAITLGLAAGKRFAWKDTPALHRDPDRRRDRRCRRTAGHRQRPEGLLRGRLRVRHQRVRATAHRAATACSPAW